LLPDWQALPGRSCAAPVHWPLDPPPFPPLVGGDGLANAGAAVAASISVAKAAAVNLRALLMLTSLRGVPERHPRRMF
jgi:hypothetical protein